MVAVDAGGGQVANPGQRGRRKDRAMCRKNGIARFIRCDGRQQMGRFGKRRRQVAGPEQRLHPLGPQLVGLFAASGRADDAPALRTQASGKGAGGIAVAKGQKRSGHGATIGGAAAVRKPDRVDFPHRLMPKCAHDRT